MVSKKRKNQPNSKFASKVKKSKLSPGVKNEGVVLLEPFSKQTMVVIASLSLIMVLLLLSTIMVFTMPVFHKAYLSDETAVSNDQSITKFLRGAGEEVLPQGLTVAEKSHLYDVRKLILYLLIALLLVFRILFYSWRNKSFSWKMRLLTKKTKPLTFNERITILLSPFIFLSLLTYIDLLFSFFKLVSFNDLFLTLHLILFPKGNFAFPANSLLIKTYPEVFFQSVFSQTIALFGTISVLLIIIYLAFNYKK